MREVVRMPRKIIMLTLVFLLAGSAYAVAAEQTVVMEITGMTCSS